MIKCENYNSVKGSKTDQTQDHGSDVIISCDTLNVNTVLCIHCDVV